MLKYVINILGVIVRLNAVEMISKQGCLMF